MLSLPKILFLVLIRLNKTGQTKLRQFLLCGVSGLATIEGTVAQSEQIAKRACS
jgi:hypothetical protein